MRTAYERFSCLDEVLARVREMSARTVIFDVEPLVASWDSARRLWTKGSCWCSAGKAVRTGLYQGFPRPGVVVGDQIATDAILARRLGYTFAQYRPPGRVPARPRLMNGFGQLVRPILFSRPG